MSKPTLHLICNAHLDPVWLWEWEEGAAAAISTFRVAADLCEEFDGFVFNHNEVILYEWVEEYEPELFKRIQRLVKEGRWHIMGGWYLQPDCNMPSGESFVRQILLGRRYFESKFGVRPTTAINFDPFGHSQGLVQILAKSGYDSYLFCRPGDDDMNLERNEFIWRGYDGSEVLATRRPSYGSPLGKAAERIKEYLDGKKGTFAVKAFTWGVGNHGGGPSRADLRDIRELIAGRGDVEIVHSTPERYFRDLASKRAELAVRDDDLNSWAVGCYTSQVMLKQRHRRLENELFATEKMLSNLWRQSKIEYPAHLLKEAMKDLCHAEFHDILPGSSIQPVEKTSLRLMDHGLEILSRLKGRAFFALSAGQPPAEEGTIPVLVHNPHPYPVEMDVECEFQLADQNHDGGVTFCRVFGDGGEVPSQHEKEASNLNLDWRKKIVFHAALAPSRINRFDCVLEKPREVDADRLPDVADASLGGDGMSVVVNPATGLLDEFVVEGRSFVRRGAFLPLVIGDSEDPWGMRVSEFRDVAGEFELMSPELAARHAGSKRASLSPVRVVEDGDVRTVVEVSMRYGDSFLLLTYRIPKIGAEMEVEVRVTWNEKDKMLKLALPLAFAPEKAFGQTAFGFHALPMDGSERVCQKWVLIGNEEEDAGLRVVNDGTYACDVKNGELRLTLLRSPAYSGHPIGDLEILEQDRFIPRIEQGERTFKFWVRAGSFGKLMESAERDALSRNEVPMALSFFPGGGGRMPLAGPILNGSRTVVLTACKKAEADDGLIVRLFNASSASANAELSVPGSKIDAFPLSFSKFEVKTLHIDVSTGEISERYMTETLRNGPGA